MEADNNIWATLLKKYLRNEITQEEMEEMERQMKSSPFKQRQFKEHTDPEVFIGQLKEAYYFDKKKSWEELQAKLPFLQEPPVIRMSRRPAFIKWAYGLTGAVLLVLGAVLWALLSSSKLPIKSYSYGIMPDGSERNLDRDTGVLYETKAYTIWYANAELVIHRKEQVREQDVKDMVAVVTSAGKVISVRLSDTSKVQLNDQSKFRAPVYFASNRREIELTGEGFFKVTSMPQVPFIVSCKNKIAVIAEGTTFNVSSYDNQEVVTTLIKGKVVMAIGKDSMPLQEGEQVATINRAAFKPKIHPDKDVVTAWTSNEFYFKNRDLKELMQEVGRWYGYEVEFTSQDAIKFGLTGKLNRNTNLEDLIALLEKGAQVNIKKEGKKLIISPDK